MPNEPFSPDAPSRTRTVALLGPRRAGATQLLQRLLSAAEAPAYNRGAAVGHCRYKGDNWRIVDAPEFRPLAGVDLAVVVCEPVPAQAERVAPLLADLESRGVTPLLFVNKIDCFTGRIRDTIAALQEVAARPLVMRQVPIREQGRIIGYIDAVSARAYRYRPHEPAALFAVPTWGQDLEIDEIAPVDPADRDAGLDEKILSDVRLTPDEIFAELKRVRRKGDSLPVLLGSALHGNGIHRLWQTLGGHGSPVRATPDRRAA
jgi:elongation factor G